MNTINGETPEFGNPEHIKFLKQSARNKKQKEYRNKMKDESDEAYNWNEDDGEGVVAYYYCIGCGNKQHDGGSCNVCTGYSLDAVYF